MPVPPSIIDSNAIAIARVPRKHEVLRQRRTGAVIEPSAAVVAADAAGADTIVNKGQLDEVNVVGYGVARRREVTASVSTINPKPVAEELAGRVAGVNIQQKSPKIMLRGLNTVDSLHNPLYVVDGKIRKDIYKINPNDLASVKVLKNTEATALYGSKAANGVLVINTKKALGRTGSDYQLKEVPISQGYASTGMPRVISGQVVDEQGHPLPGAQVKVVGKNIGIATDVNGRFQLNIADGDQLSVAYIGYNSKQLVPDSRDNLKVSLTPSSAGLSEVVVVGYGTKKEDEQAEEQVSENARPSNGWAAYNKYLKEQSKVDSKEQTGKVRLSFVVNPDGSLTDFQILKSLNKPGDENAIRIIKDGPGWKGATNGKSEKVKITIRFHQ
nr:TonB family protein [Mucilaginibacter straminoryzae]